MPVIINDFEIVLDPPPQQTPPASTGGQQQRDGGTQLRPEDIERIVRHFERRRARLRAD